ENLSEGYSNVLDEVRAALSDGLSYSDVDLREDLADVEDGAVLDNLDTFREQLNRARNLGFLVYILWVVLLALIGVLGGRDWRGRIAWAAATLGISSAIMFAASGPVYSSIGQSRINDLRADVMQDMTSPTQLLAVEKGLDVVQTLADDFLDGIERSSLMLAVLAAMAFAATRLWPKFVRRTSLADEAEAEGRATQFSRGISGGLVFYGPPPCQRPGRRVLDRHRRRVDQFLRAIRHVGRS
ncbi:MAG: hypothetical protein QF579_00890, partial [Dehalococcoidia bacterium]|nr:hypothetical protein [Dehalococcoidia bacterium]